MKVLGCIGLLLLVVGLDLLIAWGFEVLWNWLIPSLFHGPILTYWEALGLMFLINFIGGFFKSSSK